MVLGNSIACNPATTYTLITTSTDGGNVTTPGESTYTYNASQVVNLVATPDSGYRFVNWTGGGTDIANATAATTIITMNAGHTVTAHFAINATMNFIANVPDTNVPPTSVTPNCCAPIAMVNILGYWDEVIGSANATNVTAWLVPHNLNTVADYVRYFMDTNNIAPAARGNPVDGHFGTYARDILMLTGGKLDYVRWDNAHNFTTPPPVLPAGKVGHNWTGFNDYCTAPVGFPFIKIQIDAGQPLVVCYAWWNLIPGINVTDPQSGQVISVYRWGAPSFNSSSPNPVENWTGYETGEGCIGHAVTGVGYILNWNPIGLGVDNWTIVHDTWGTTPKNIAVPWTGAPWNSSHSVIPGP
jgi:hypothetical protein